MSTVTAAHMVTCVMFKPVVGRKTTHRASGSVKKLDTAERAVSYFESKLEKWTANGAEIATLIPNMAFQASMPNGFKIYYELVTTADQEGAE